MEALDLRHQVSMPEARWLRGAKTQNQHSQTLRSLKRDDAPYCHVHFEYGENNAERSAVPLRPGRLWSPHLTNRTFVPT